MMLRAVLRSLPLVALLGLFACVGSPMSDHPCPNGGTTLTYANFGKNFFGRWCVTCHGGANGYSGRSFTTLADIQANADRIYINAAGDNSFMPPGPDGPPHDQREQLADWLACGAPQ